MTTDPIANVYCINRLILNEWYGKRQNSLSVFNTDFLPNSIDNKITKRISNILYQNKVEVYVFNNTEKNYLTVSKKLISNCEYTVNVALFVVDDNINFKMEIGQYISIIDDIILKNISSCNNELKIPFLSKNFFECKISKGYSILSFRIITHIITKNISYYNIKYTLGDLFKGKKFLVENQKETDSNLLINIEKEITQSNNLNKIINTDYVSPYLLNRPNFKFIYIKFDERYNYNNSQICRLWAIFLTGIDFQELDEISLRQNLYLSNYPDYFEDIIL
jgi:hypothetical protein